jgi:hypothetical protein
MRGVSARTARVAGCQQFRTGKIGMNPQCSADNAMTSFRFPKKGANARHMLLLTEERTNANADP